MLLGCRMYSPDAPTYRSHGRMGLLGEENPRLFQRQRLGLREGIARFYDLVPDLRHRRQIVLPVGRVTFKANGPVCS